jgi:hypothetical protein
MSFCPDQIIQKTHLESSYALFHFHVVLYFGGIIGYLFRHHRLSWRHNRPSWGSAKGGSLRPDPLLVWSLDEAFTEPGLGSELPREHF